MDTEKHIQCVEAALQDYADAVRDAEAWYLAWKERNRVTEKKFVPGTLCTEEDMANPL